MAAVVSVTLMLLSLPALAGRVQLRDPGGLLSQADVSALQEVAAGYPFDARVLATSEYENKADFDRHVRAQVNAPNAVVIGIDRTHRFTSVHFGTGLGVPPSQFKAIEQAGNPHFKEGNWRAGVEAILKETRQAAHGAAGSTAGEAAKPRSTAGMTVFYGLIAVLVVGGLIALVGSVLSRRAREAQLGPPGYPPGAAPGPYPPGGPPPGYGPGPYGPGYGGGGSGMGTNIASAALGGLAGYQLGKMAGDHHDHGGQQRDENQAGVVGGDHRDNHDAGGSTGGWDDDPGGGGDWGGGDSGGGDWGGGGDGGGSDW